MTKDDIIRMAREDGFGELQTNALTHKFVRFAALVAEAERKRADALAATVAALRDVVTTDAETKGEFVSRVCAVLGEDPDARVLDAVLAERERCAKVAEAEDVAPTDHPIGVKHCIATAIRAKGST
jgi:hypothetical protein